MNGLFKVRIKGLPMAKEETVYAVSNDKDIIQFLIYDYDEWIWVSAYLYKPISD